MSKFAWRKKNIKKLKVENCPDHNFSVFFLKSGNKNQVKPRKRKFESEQIPEKEQDLN